MTVKDIMKRSVVTCAPGDDVGTAAKDMHDRHCGFVPVVDGHGAVTGVLTDRDVCMALAVHQHRSPDRLAVQDIMSTPVFSCFPDENLKVVLATMARHHVRRLPVIDKQGHLQCVLSIDDIVQIPHKRGAPTAVEIVDTFRAIGARRPIEAPVG